MSRETLAARFPAPPRCDEDEFSPVRDSDYESGSFTKGSFTKRKPRLMLTTQQQAVIDRLNAADLSSRSLVVTNPLCPGASYRCVLLLAPTSAALKMKCCSAAGNPIVFVSEAWQQMCGFTSTQAIGSSCSLVQGPGTDEAAKLSLATALYRQQACSALMLNYKSGMESLQFWNMLSLSPICRKGKLMLYAVPPPPDAGCAL